jgi:hypothetical protein
MHSKLIESSEDISITLAKLCIHINSFPSLQAESWLKIKLEVVEQWMNNSQLQQRIRVECPTCGADKSESQLRKDQLPFLVISTRSITAVSQ